MTWDQLGQMDADDIRGKKMFPRGFMRLPHVKHAVGGQVFPQVQIEDFPVLNVSMSTSTCRIAFYRNFLQLFFLQPSRVGRCVPR